jgi:uncharacterized protein
LTVKSPRFRDTDFGDAFAMIYRLNESDLTLLRETGVSEPDTAHCVKVAEKALEIAKRTGAELDLELVGRGALLHDLGKAKTHDIEHGKIGAELGAGLGLHQSVLDIMEEHVRGGLTADEATELGLPVKEYSLRTLEERIVIYADRLVDIITDPNRIVSSEGEAEERFDEILTTNVRYGKNVPTLERYLGYHRETQDLIRGASNDRKPS